MITFAQRRARTRAGMQLARITRELRAISDAAARARVALELLQQPLAHRRAEPNYARIARTPRPDPEGPGMTSNPTYKHQGSRTITYRLSFVRYGGEETINFACETDARTMLNWFRASSASVNELLVEVSA